MKVIFLDNDGVICLSNNWGSRYKKQRRVYTENNPRPLHSQIDVENRFDNFDRKAIKVLNQILEETDAEIVVSSDWRFHATLEELGNYYLQQGIVKRPMDFTGNTLPRDAKFWDSKTDLEETRSYEILDWLKQHPEVQHWVAVDDLDMSERFDNSTGSYMWGLKNFVWVPRSNEGIKQSGIKEKIIHFLNN